MSWKRMIFGEKTPDKNDPKYKERYQKEVEAGRKTARFLKIDRLSAKIQTFASKWPRTFLSIVVTLMIFCFCYNGYILLQVFSRPNRTVTATQIQRQRIDKRKADKLETLRPEKIIPMTENPSDNQSVNAEEKYIEESTANVEAHEEVLTQEISPDEVLPEEILHDKPSEVNMTEIKSAGNNNELECEPTN